MGSATDLSHLVDSLGEMPASLMKNIRSRRENSFAKSEYVEDLYIHGAA